MSRPVALFVGEPGGSVDAIAADPDVTTFLNDRFHPVFQSIGGPASRAGQAAETVWFLSADGCTLALPERPVGPAALIDAANAVIVLPEARDHRGDRLSLVCPR